MARDKAAPAPRPETQAEVDERGRLTVTLDGQEYLLRPSREAITTVERRLGLPLYDLTTLASRVALTLEQMAVITAEFMRAQGRTLPDDDPGRNDYIGAKEDRLSDLIFEAGPPSICARLYVLLLGAISGGYTAAGEAKAAAMTQASK